MSLDFNSLAYIDIDDALKRVGGNKGLYVKLLGRFTEGNHMETLESAISGGNLEEAAHLAHTLKGVSANLSLMRVAAIATSIDEALKSGGDYSVLLPELKLAYEATIGQIAEISV